MTTSEKQKETENIYEAYKKAYPEASIKDELDLVNHLLFLISCSRPDRDVIFTNLNGVDN